MANVTEVIADLRAQWSLVGAPVDGRARLEDATRRWFTRANDAVPQWGNAEIVRRLKELGWSGASVHWGNGHIWVVPEYLSPENARKLVAFCELSGLKWRDVDVALVKCFHQGAM